MDAKRLLIGSAVGAVVLFVVGYLFWGLLFVGFFESQQPAGLARESPVLWSGVVSALLFGALLTLVIHWTGSASVSDGFKMGALVGLLVWGGADLILYGNFNFATLSAACADIILETIHNGLAAAAIAAVIGSAAVASTAGGSDTPTAA